MKRILTLWLAAMLVAVQPCYAVVLVGFGQDIGPTLYSDTFERTTVNPLGSPWTTLGTFDNLQIVDNSDATGSTTGDGAMYYNSTVSEDQVSRVTFASSTGYTYTGPIVRAGTDGKSCYTFYFTGSQAFVQYRNSAGGATTIGSAITTTTPTAGTVYELKMIGTTLTASINGVEKFSNTPGTIITGGYPGIFINGTANKIESWEGGSQ